MRHVFVGKSMEHMDTAQHLLGNAKADWVKNDRVRRKIEQAIRIVVQAREIAIGDTLRSQGIQVKLGQYRPVGLVASPKRIDR